MGQGFDGGVYFGDHPCVLTENDSVMNKLDIFLLAPDGFSEEIVLIPMFTPVQPVTATLTYSLPTIGSDSHVDYSAQSSVLENYTITLNNVDRYYLENYDIYLWGVAVDYARIGATDGFEQSKFYSRIIGDPVQMQGASLKYRISNRGTDTDNYWTASYDSNGVMSLSTALVNLALDDGDALKLYPYTDNTSKKNNTFVRGLCIAQYGSGDEPSTMYYKPHYLYKDAIPAQGESYKYSCFVTGEGSDLKFGRVFTASDIFSTSPASPEGVTITYYNSATSARIIDMVGSDQYGKVYYGGEISPYAPADGNSDSKTFFGSARGEVKVGDIASYTKKSYRSDNATNIYSYLGENFAGGAGILKINPFHSIGVSNFTTAYAYEVTWAYIGQSSHERAEAFGPFSADVPIGDPPAWCWKTLYELTGGEDLGGLNLVLSPGDGIYDIPDGFVFGHISEGYFAIYVGTADYSVPGKGDLTAVNAAEHRAVVTDYLS